MSFSSDGATLATVSRDRTLRLWNMAAGVSAEPITAHDEPALCAAYAPDAGSVATSGEDGVLRVWSAATGKERSHHELKAHAPALAYSPDGSRVAAGLKNGNIVVWEVGAKVKTLTGHVKPIAFLAFSPDGQDLISGSQDSSVRIWALAAGAEKTILTGFPKSYTAMAVSADQKTVAFALADKKIALWSLETGRETAVLAGHGDTIDALAFSPDGALLASGGKDQAARLWELSGGPPALLNGHKDWVSALAFSPDGSVLATGSWDKTIRLWDVAAARASAVPEVSTAPAVVPVATTAPQPPPAQAPLPRRFPWELVIGSVCAVGLGVIGWLRRPKPPAPPPPVRTDTIVLDPLRPAEPGAGRKVVLGGRFELLHRLGMGPVGSVYEGADKEKGAPVIIQKLRDDLRLDAAARQVFIRAGGPAAKLRHPGIVSIEAVLEEGENLYVVRAATAGASLADALEAGRRLGHQECRGLLEVLASALDYAHAAGVCHGDLTPAAVLIDAAGAGKLADFAVSRLVRAALLKAGRPEELKAVCHRAPEDGAGASPSGDLYSLASVLYLSLTGVAAFPGPDLASQKNEMIFAHPSQIVRGLPQGLGDFFHKALAHDPAARFKSGKEMLAAF